MSVFEYKAVDSFGKTVLGRVEASNDEDLELRLERMGLGLVTFRPARKARIGFRRQKVGRQELVTFCFHLEQLIRAGVPILEALTDLRDSVSNQGFRETVSAVIEEIQGGKTLSQALADFPTIFSPIFVNLIAAGEESGELPEILRNLIESLKWQDELAAQTKKIILYPAFVAVVISGVIMFLMVYLVPQLVGFIENVGESVPLHTRVLIYVSDAIISYWYVFVTVPIATFAALRLWAKGSRHGRYWIDKLKLQLRPVGPIYKKILLARFTSNFALLYRAGVTVLDCLRMGKSLVGNDVVTEALQRAQTQISNGVSLTHAFENTGLFPPLVVRMMRVGETSGALDTALENVSYFYNRDVKESIERVQSMIEPVLTLVLGAMLGWVMMSVLAPIYDLLGDLPR